MRGVASMGVHSNQQSAKGMSHRARPAPGRQQANPGPLGVSKELSKEGRATRGRRLWPGKAS